jgi:hypothetical protein
VATFLDVEARFPCVRGYRAIALLLVEIGKTGWHEQSPVASPSLESFRGILAKRRTSPTRKLLAVPGLHDAPRLLAVEERFFHHHHPRMRQRRRKGGFPLCAVAERLVGEDEGMELAATSLVARPGSVATSKGKRRFSAGR